MKLKKLRPEEARGGIVVHSLKLPNNKRIAKGTVVDDDLIAQLQAHGVSSLSIALLEAGDVEENVAASRIGKLFEHAGIRVDGAHTGRVNIHAKCAGLLEINSGIINAINGVDPDITVATLANSEAVSEGRLIATIKIIPYGVRLESLETVCALVETAPLNVRQFIPKRVGMISTILPTLKPATIDKTIKTLERRLERLGSRLVCERRSGHDVESVVCELEKMVDDVEVIVIFGASAISDAYDIIPEAIRKAGGEIIRFGMPVDPGNLLLLGKLGTKPVIGAPGCARSSAQNGFDWVLHRILAEREVSSEEISNMGVGGLLMEIGSRPSPREQGAESDVSTADGGKLAAIILAAGQSRRMGDENKLSLEVHGKAMVRQVMEAACASKADHVYVVTGHEADIIETLGEGLELEFLHNDCFDQGLSTSLVTGIEALDETCEFAMILLGDMPFLTASMLDKMISEARKAPAGSIIMATSEGKRGNPVIWPRCYFEQLKGIEGDNGARHLIGQHRDLVVEVELGEAAARDLDTPEALLAAGGWIAGE